ncbi:MAG: FtsW/RodA/SpoVE family cell cycle protein [Bacteroidales bacterium]|jgi:cell division protein FtsW|nr:FtsW/RodA/SpoVE family cell cycle protein [Bacteroidales bacterium]
MEPLNQQKKISLFKGDKIILIVVIFLFSISILGVYSNTMGSLVSTIFAAVLGLACMVGVSFISYQWISRFALLGLFVALGLLLISLFYPSGGDLDADLKGRAIKIGGFTFQTFYLIGFLVIFFVSKVLATRLAHQEELSKQDNIMLLVVVLGFCAGMAWKNVSTALILFITCAVILFIGRMQRKYILTLFILGICGAGLYFMTGVGRGSTFNHRVHYYITEDNTDDYGEQTILAKAAIARSGVLPAGPGNGLIKNELGQNDTDYIYASIFEELGLVFGFLILGSYIVLFYRSWKIACRSDGPFGLLLALGIGFWVASQALIHIGVNCELLPATGQTLPFISRGTASTIVSSIAMGIVLNVGKTAKIQEEI